MGKEDFLSYSAPGRVCLYGEHQDYLKLTVLPAAINLRTILQVRKNASKIIKVESQQSPLKDTFSTKKSLNLANNEFDYLRAIIITLYKKKIIESMPGFDVKINSEIPIGSGLSSSAALLVAWLNALNDQLNLSLTKMEIANLCYIAENQIMGINCGIMDQFSSSLGGIFSLNCEGPPYKITTYKTSIQNLIIGDTKIHRAANQPLTQLKTQLFSGLSKIQERSFYNVRDLTIKKLKSMKDKLTLDEYVKLIGAIKIRDITQNAIDELSKSKQNLDLLGDLLTQQQIILKENLGVSVPKLDKLVEVSIDAGALGGKLTGAGLGGCIVVLAPRNEKEVAKAIENVGGKAYICNIDFSGGHKGT